MNKVSFVTFIGYEPCALPGLLEHIYLFKNLDEKIVVINSIDINRASEMKDIVDYYECQAYLKPEWNPKSIGFGDLRDFSMRLANNDYVFMIDADERFSNTNVDFDKIIEDYSTDEIQAFAFPRSIYAGFKPVPEEALELHAYPDYQVRLMNQKKGEWKRELHEYWDGCAVKKLGEMYGKILHYQYAYKKNREQERLRLYEELANRANVSVYGGFPIE